MLLATQNLSDIFHSPVHDVVLESCPTKILLPNAEAANPASRTFYEKLGLNSREIEIVQTSVAKVHYYVVSPVGRRLIVLTMGNVALSFAGVSSKEDQQSAMKLMERYGEDDWVAEWLRSRELANWAAYFEELKAERRIA